MKKWLFNHIKNIPGWRTPRKLVVFSVDDYGNIRLDSKKARANMDKAGLKVYSRFDAYDTLETREDLEALYEVLSSVKDKKGRHAVFTPFALSCNINFEKMAEENYQQYRYEQLPDTFTKLAQHDPDAYEGVWDLWKEGIEKGLMKPQYHGREHLNVKVLNEKLQQRDEEVLIALKNRSYTSISNSGYATINYTVAFDFYEPQENERLKKIAVNGLADFRKVFNYKATHFMAPGAKAHHTVLDALAKEGISLVDRGLIHKQHQGYGKYKRTINYTGKQNSSDQKILVRNVVFEPTENSNVDSVAKALKQIGAAFLWNKPAVISSHRVNYCGHISEDNRKKGLGDLRKLLEEIVKKWPDVEFVTSKKLQDLMMNK